jgi:hypothetical protein
VGWRRLGTRMAGRHLKPRPSVWRAACRLPRWLSNPSASHRIARTPRPNELPVAPRSLASFALCRCGKLGVSTRPHLSTASSTPPSHQRRRHLISHPLASLNHRPLARPFRVGSLWLVDFPTNVFAFRKDDGRFYIDGTACFTWDRFGRPGTRARDEPGLAFF